MKSNREQDRANDLARDLLNNAAGIIEKDRRSKIGRKIRNIASSIARNKVAVEERVKEVAE